MSSDAITATAQSRQSSEYVQLSLLGGTTTTDDLFTLGTTFNSQQGVVNFSGADAVFRVNTNNLTVAQANTAITSGYIMQNETAVATTAFVVEVVDLDETGYTQIKVAKTPAGTIILIY